ncbi:MAG TPA: hypothetical protein VHP30_04610, partial [Ignavibacteriales bacterium]|nr:hypothetical protein [Ignavibacteriales bacterium]
IPFCINDIEALPLICGEVIPRFLAALSKFINILISLGCSIALASLWAPKQTIKRKSGILDILKNVLRIP